MSANSSACRNSEDRCLAWRRVRERTRQWCDSDSVEQLLAWCEGNVSAERKSLHGNLPL
jgi:hypothetical protein